MATEQKGPLSALEKNPRSCNHQGDRLQCTLAMPLKWLFSTKDLMPDDVLGHTPCSTIAITKTCGRAVHYVDRKIKKENHTVSRNGGHLLLRYRMTGHKFRLSSPSAPLACCRGRKTSTARELPPFVFMVCTVPTESHPLKWRHTEQSLSAQSPL